MPRAERGDRPYLQERTLEVLEPQKADKKERPLAGKEGRGNARPLRLDRGKSLIIY